MPGGAWTKCEAGHNHHADESCPYCTLTGGRIYLSHEFYDSSFEDRTAPERVFHTRYRIGAQNGTYFKTSKKKGGMTVWLWGGVHPDDLARGWVAGGNNPIDSNEGER